jgi:hydroxypyruvate reductase
MNRRALERVFAAALADLDVAARVGAALGRRGWEPRSKVCVLAVGKAAPRMAAGAFAALGSAVERCLLVAPDGADLTPARRAASRARCGERLLVHTAGHPLPDARSVRAGDACLGLVESAASRELLVLVSGGASALVCAPAAGVTLARKRAITRALLASGATVEELNVVRKHLSRLKGGGLLRAAGSRPVQTLVVSDVIGGTASDVGSGPSVPDVSTVPEARRLLLRYAPRFGSMPLVKTLAPLRAAMPVRAAVVVSPEELGRAVAASLRERGLIVRLLPPSQAPVEELAAEYAALALHGRGRTHAFVRVAEPRVVVDRAAIGRGRGGRSTHLAALVGRALADGPRSGALFGAFATDGVDGDSGTAGAVVDGHFASRVANRLGGQALARSIARFDAGPLHLAVGTSVACHPSGHNLADLHILVVG